MKIFVEVSAPSIKTLVNNLRKEDLYWLLLPFGLIYQFNVLLEQFIQENVPLKLNE